MHNMKFFLSFVLVSFIAQGIFTGVQAVPPASSEPAPSSAGPTDAVPPALEKKIPELSELVDSSDPSGLNLEKVKERQEALRKAGQLGGKQEVSVDITNIRSLKRNLDEVKKMRAQITQLKTTLQKTMVKFNEEKDKRKKNALEDAIKKLNESITTENQKLVRYKNEAVLNPEIERLEGEVLKVLQPMGLTHDQLKQLPPLE